MKVVIVVVVALAGGIVGGVAGWFSAPLLVPEEPLFAAFLWPTVVPCGAAIGLLLGLVIGVRACNLLRRGNTPPP